MKALFIAVRSRLSRSSAAGTPTKMALHPHLTHLLHNVRVLDEDRRHENRPKTRCA